MLATTFHFNKVSVALYRQVDWVVTLYSSHYQSSGYASFEQNHRAGGSAEMGLMTVAQKSHDFTDPPVPEFVIAAARQTDMAFSWNIGEGWTEPMRVTGGSLHILPPDTEAQIRAVGDQDMLFLSVPSDEISRLLDRSGSSMTKVVEGNTDYFHDARLMHLLDDMWDEAGGADPASMLKLDGLLLSILGGLLLRAEKPLKLSSAGLSTREMNLLTEFIEQHLDEQIRLECLAELVGLSRFQLSRSFKAATGQSPYQFLLERRIARARGLLAMQSESLAGIAYSCGFASQSHMTDVFRKAFKMSPGRYRQSRLG